MREVKKRPKPKVLKGLWKVYGRFQLAAFASAAVPVVAHAQQSPWTWTNNAGGLWSDSNNWLDAGNGLFSPASAANTTILFAPTTTSYLVTNDVANFTLSNLSFSHTAGTITLANAPFHFTNEPGNGFPVINVTGAGHVVISAGINHFATGNAGSNLPLQLNLTSTGNLTLSGVLGGNVTNSGGFHGFLANGNGTGTLTFSGTGTTGYWHLNNRNTVVSGGTYNLSSTFADSSLLASSSLVVGAMASDDTSSLTVTNASVLNVVSATIGQAAGSNATATITGTGTTFNAGTTTANLSPTSFLGAISVGGAGTGNLSVTAGAVLNSYFLNVGQYATGIGHVVVSGSESRLNVVHNTANMVDSGMVLVGLRGTGCVTVDSGGNFTARSMMVGCGTGSAAGNGTLTVTGAGSVVNLGGALAQNSPGSLVIANGTASTSDTTYGRLSIRDGGRVNVNLVSPTSGNFSAAHLAKTQADITVEGVGSQLIVGNMFALGGSLSSLTGGGNVVLNIAGGGLVQAGNFTYFGKNAGSTAVSISGTGSTFFAAANFQAGNGTANTSVLIDNGGNLSIAGSAQLGAGCSTSNLTITNSGSSFSVAGQFQTSSGNTLIRISNGGLATVGGCATLGGGAGNTTLTIPDSGSTFNALSCLALTMGNANVVVTNGGTLTVGMSTFLAINAAGRASLLVDGPGSLFSVAGQFQTNAGTANIVIQNGANLTAGSNVYLARAATSNTSLTVHTNGSFLANTSTLTLEQGNAEVQVLGGGRLLANTIIAGNLAATSCSTILVDGIGSQLTTLAQLQLKYGDVHLDVRNGGNVSAGLSIFLGLVAGGNIFANVSDPNSILRTDAALSVGGASNLPGSPTVLNVGNFGTVFATGVLTLYQPGTVNVLANGTLDVGGLANGNATNFGIINTQVGGLLRTAPSTGSVTFSGAIQGGGSLLKDGPGTQVLDGSNTYTGGTVVQGGTLVVRNTSGSGTGTGSVVVQGSGILAGSGIITGDVTILSGGTLTGGPTGTDVLTLLGNTTIAGGLLSIGIAGSDAGSHDQILLGSTGTLTLSSDALLRTGIFYEPTLSDVITIVQGTGSSPQVFGTFAGLPHGSIIHVGQYAGNGNDYFGVIHYTSNSIYIDSLSTTPVPEPGAIVFMSSAAVGVCGWIRRRRKATSPPAETGGLVG